MISALLQKGIPDNIHITILSAAHPSRYGAGLHIRYATLNSPSGLCFIAAGELGICYLGFPRLRQEEEILELLRGEWPQAVFIEDDLAMGKLAMDIFQATKKPVINIVLKGTDFQLSVWTALLAIPAGIVVTYTDIARHIQKPNAVRAVGTAIGNNPVSYIIPCHRVVPKTGGTGKYLWGSECKKNILASEKVLLPRG